MLYPIAPLSIAIGKPQLQLHAVLASAAVQIVGLVPGLYLAGIRGVACVVTMGWLAQYFIYVPALRRAIGLRYNAFGRAVAPALLAGAAMLLGNEQLEVLFPSTAASHPSLGRLLMQTGTLTLVFLLMHEIASRGRLLAQASRFLRTAKAA